ncbi:unnamed protein product [Leptidea sinapis]|uniref:Uncharacterized protein n=1 Tax=Leptidea sinapis TaxID=189913 RepID=A0A5E4PL33_9NEOP|nr:unnamed protein product [Leptidea sinapis]
MADNVAFDDENADTSPRRREGQSDYGKLYIKHCNPQKVPAYYQYRDSFQKLVMFAGKFGVAINWIISQDNDPFIRTILICSVYLLCQLVIRSRCFVFSCGPNCSGFVEKKVTKQFIHNDVIITIANVYQRTGKRRLWGHASTAKIDRKWSKQSYIGQSVCERLSLNDWVLLICTERPLLYSPSCSKQIIPDISQKTTETLFEVDNHDNDGSK